jgi:hypothetical protein
MTFDSNDLSADGDLVEVLKKAAKQGVVERGDLGDFSPFDWVSRLYKDSPAWRDGVDDAFASLLFAESPLPALVLEQVSKLPVRSFLPRLYATIEGRCAELAARADTTRTDGRSVLGSIVATAGMMGKCVHPSVTLARELAAIDRPADGWPTSLRLALPGDVAGLLPRVITLLNQFDDHQLYEFINSALSDGPPWTDVVLDEIGRGSTELRDRVARAVRRSMDEMEQSRAAFAAMTFDDPELQALVHAGAARPNPWPEYAKRLGVDVAKP